MYACVFKSFIFAGLEFYYDSLRSVRVAVIATVHPRDACSLWTAPYNFISLSRSRGLPWAGSPDSAVCPERSICIRVPFIEIRDHLRTLRLFNFNITHTRTIYTRTSAYPPARPLSLVPPGPSRMWIILNMFISFNRPRGEEKKECACVLCVLSTTAWRHFPRFPNLTMNRTLNHWVLINKDPAGGRSTQCC